MSASGTDCNTISSNPAIITVVAQHTASITGNQTICSGGTASFTATVSGGSGTITYQWQDSPDGTTWANICEPLQQHLPHQLLQEIPITE
ncbi:MAG: hypothetical protein IPI53_11375 [Saprospiraceae bacterium]|nr:hypothetical protein [Saprospiraceae bacterium]